MSHAGGESPGFWCQVHSLTRMPITQSGCESLIIIGSRWSLLNKVSRLWVALRLLFPAMLDDWQGCVKMHPVSESLSGYSWPSWMTEKAVWKCIQRVSCSQAIPAKLDDQQGCVKAHSPYELISAAGYSLPSQVVDKDVWKCIQEVRGLACYYTWTGDIQVYAGQNSFGTLSSCIQEYPYYNLFLIDAFPPAHPE